LKHKRQKHDQVEPGQDDPDEQVGDEERFALQGQRRWAPCLPRSAADPVRV
jgi:hypothetical protein